MTGCRRCVGKPAIRKRPPKAGFFTTARDETHREEVEAPLRRDEQREARRGAARRAGLPRRHGPAWAQVLVQSADGLLVADLEEEAEDALALVLRGGCVGVRARIASPHPLFVRG